MAKFVEKIATHAGGVALVGMWLAGLVIGFGANPWKGIVAFMIPPYGAFVFLQWVFK